MDYSHITDPALRERSEKFEKIFKIVYDVIMCYPILHADAVEMSEEITDTLKAKLKMEAE